MKIDGPKSSSEINKKKSAKKSSSGDGVFQSMMGGEDNATEETSQAGLSAGIASVDILLAAQSVEDSTQKSSKQRMKKRADDILDTLNDLKIAMVTGNVTIGHMISIADVVASHRDSIIDAELSTILDEIDLRAHVELAKLGMAKKSL